MSFHDNTSRRPLNTSPLYVRCVSVNRFVLVVLGRALDAVSAPPRHATTYTQGHKTQHQRRQRKMERKPKKKGPAPAHQNTFAFRHNKGSKLTAIIRESPVDLVCRRCAAQIQWKKDYRKYKPKTVVGRCRKCDEKTVKKAYHVMCDNCAESSQCCAKCCLSVDRAGELIPRFVSNVLRHS